MGAIGPQVGVIGAGAWGTALAQMLAADGRDVLLWAREPELVEEINARHTNSLFLPSARLAPAIRATGDLAETAACEALLLVTPAQHLAATLAQMPIPSPSKGPRELVLCAKGIEAGSGRLMSEVAHAAAPASDIAVLSGPTFAHEVAAGLPTAVTLACGGGRDQWERLAAAIARPTRVSVSILSSTPDSRASTAESSTDRAMRSGYSRSSSRRVRSPTSSMRAETRKDCPM